MNTLFALVLVIYAPVNHNTPMPNNYNPPVIDSVEMQSGMNEKQCVSMMLEIQDKISPESNIEYVCQSTTLTSDGKLLTIYPN